jgi:hypothetical protein
VKYQEGDAGTLLDLPDRIDSDGPKILLKATVNNVQADKVDRIILEVTSTDPALQDLPSPVQVTVPPGGQVVLDPVAIRHPAVYQLQIRTQKAGQPTVLLNKTLTIRTKTALNAPDITKITDSLIVGQQNADYEIDDFRLPLRLSGRSVKFQVAPRQADDAFQGPSVQLKLVKKNGSLPDTELYTQSITKSTDVAFTQELPKGENDLVAVVEKGWTRRESLKPVVAYVPEPHNPLEPVITEYANGEHAERRTLVGVANVAVYGTYLHLFGQNAPGAGGRLSFRVFTLQGTSLRLVGDLTPPVKSDDKGNWDAVLALPNVNALTKQTGIVVALVEKNGYHNYSNLVSYTSSPVSPLSIPSFDKLFLPTDLTTALVPVANVYRTNVTSVVVTGSGPKQDDTQVLVLLDGDKNPKQSVPLVPATAENKGTWQARLDNLPVGDHLLTFALAQNGQVGPSSPPVRLMITKKGPRVLGVEPPNFGTAPGVHALTIQFDPANPLNPDTARDTRNYVLLGSGGSGVFNRGTETQNHPQGDPALTFDPQRNLVVLRFKDLQPDIYQLVVFGSPALPAPDAKPGDKPALGIMDIYGNSLEGQEGQPKTDYKVVLGKPAACAGDTQPIQSRGITGDTGPYVTYPEYTQPKTFPSGFNPADFVETRVSRLYYFRDAHRVAQIIARKYAKSWNRQPVAVRQREAERAREKANKLTDERRLLESRAVIAAQNARQAEQALQQEQATVASATRETQAAQTRLAQIDQAVAGPIDPARAEQLRNERINVQAALNATGAIVATANDRIQAAIGNVQAARNQQIQANEAVQTTAAREERAAAEAFQREVAAANEDPDTYAPGDPDSIDPVRQVSVSVIGEGVLQMRGPIRGINKIRIMINQIDAPVGQVRVTVHTVQINGEHGDRMEKVAGRIQRYIDHARFLTSQSGQMLRKAVAVVAARKAEEAAVTCPNDSQEARDERYLYAFFGRDFIEELRSIDSEFLKTGNKVLSLHSMDTTSLASALFLLALAKNTTRQEIMAEFQRMTGSELPAAEQEYFTASSPEPDHHPFPFFSENARFQSLLGFFNAPIQGPDTLSPIQREFIRLAQIFKSRLVTELEYNQRVKERAIIEERLRSYPEQLRAIQAQEDAANLALNRAQASLDQQRADVLEVFTKVLARLHDLLSRVDRDLQEARQTQAQRERLTGEYTALIDRIINTHGLNRDLVTNEAEIASKLGEIYRQVVASNLAGMVDPRDLRQLQQTELYFRQGVIALRHPANNPKEWVFDPAGQAQWNQWVESAVDLARRIMVFRFPPEMQAKLQEEIRDLEALRVHNQVYRPGLLPRLLDFYSHLEPYVRILRAAGADVDARANTLIAELSRQDVAIREVYERWVTLRDWILSQVQGSLLAEAQQLFGRLDEGFAAVLRLDLQYQFARRNAVAARHPLDHKKLLDMLIDEIEDKYIDLLEGTRAHTANIDNYIKQVATALDDDFNTQFYYPAFREVRKASRFWDVTLGQIETTSVLTNNREFAKVEPQATMEFDLPKRDILITEAMRDAKGLIDTYGALVQDPSFLALTKLRSGQPTSSPVQGAAGGLSTVRQVLPGLPSQTEERVLSQVGPGNRQFGTPLDALVPAPAIYKFETGTGFEIRPVLSPDGQSVVFHFQYMYTTNVREPVRADEKHLGRVKRHFVDTDVQLGNYELREISRYLVALKVSRTSRGVPGLEDIPGLGILFRPLPSAESSLQENIILGQSTIFPTLFDLMGLRWAPAVADLDPLGIIDQEFVVRSRRQDLMNHVFDFATSKVDETLRIPPAERRTDLYRTQETIPYRHPNGYQGPGLNLRDSQLREGYDPRRMYPDSRFVPGASKEGTWYRPGTGLPAAPAPDGLPPVPGAPVPTPPGPPLVPGAPVLPPAPVRGPARPGPGGLPAVPGAFSGAGGWVVPAPHAPTAPARSAPPVLPFPRKATDTPAPASTGPGAGLSVPALGSPLPNPPALDHGDFLLPSLTDPPRPAQAPAGRPDTLPVWQASPSPPGK